MQAKMSKRNKTLYKANEDFESTETIYHNESRIDKFVTCATITLGLAMLIAPLWWLQYSTVAGGSTRYRLLIITCFIIGFAFLVSIITVSRPPEVLGATAAYGAVLMVFIQLQSSAPQ